MEEFLPVLERCPLFADIAPGDLGALLVCLQAKTREAQKGTQVLAEGDRATYVGIVLAGSVQVERVDFYGNRSILAQAAPGELFGESFACARAGRMPVSVVAAQDSRVLLVECGRITTGCSNACSFHSQLMANLLQIVARKNLQLSQKIQITAQRTTREKLMAYLLAQAKQQGSDSFSIPFDRQALADFLQVERSAMSAEIGKLRKEGVLESHKNQFRLLSGRNYRQKG